MKRTLLAAACMLVTVSLSTHGQSANRAGLTNYAERPPAMTFHENVFGVAIDDEYRWMENPARAAEWSSWVQHTGEHTRTQLAALPGRERLAERLQRLSRSS